MTGETLSRARTHRRAGARHAPLERPSSTCAAIGAHAVDLDGAAGPDGVLVRALRRSPDGALGGVGRRYGCWWALRDCSLPVLAARIAALVGADGAGKTTLLHLPVGLSEPTVGRRQITEAPEQRDPVRAAQLARRRPPCGARARHIAPDESGIDRLAGGGQRPRVLARYNLAGMPRRRELFMLVAVVAVDPGQGRHALLEVAMHELEQATRDAVHDVGQRVIEARVAPGDLTGTVLVDIRFSGDRAGAVAALERWRQAITDVGGGSVVLRTLLRGADVNMEWSDDEYDKELQARERSPDIDSPTRQLGGSRPPQRSWLTDWEEAARHPWKTRLFMIAGSALLGVPLATLTGHLTAGSLAVAAGLAVVIGVAMGEYAMRAMRRLGADNRRS